MIDIEVHHYGAGYYPYNLSDRDYMTVLKVITTTYPTNSQQPVLTSNYIPVALHFYTYLHPGRLLHQGHSLAPHSSRLLSLSKGNQGDPHLYRGSPDCISADPDRQNRHMSTD